LNGLKQAPSYRNGLLTFRAPEAKGFSPLKVYKVGAGNALVLDETLTAASKAYEPVSAFDDADFGPDAEHIKDPRLTAAVAIVQPKGVKFRVERPGSDITAQFGAKGGMPAALGTEADRAPMVKLFIDWNSETAAAASETQVRSFVAPSRIPASHQHNGFCGHLHE